MAVAPAKVPAGKRTGTVRPSVTVRVDTSGRGGSHVSFPACLAFRYHGRLRGSNPGGYPPCPG